MLQHAIGASQRIMMNLRPPILDQGLVAAVQWLASSFERRTGVPTVVHTSIVVDLPAEVQLVAYRTAQEALTNIRQHAMARQVKLILQVGAGQLELVIEDDGVGFPTGWVRGRHHGLAGMKHRVQMCAGDFTITSKPGQGTRIVVHIPLPAAQPEAAITDQPGAASRT